MISKYRSFFLLIIILISLGLHLFNLSFPNKAVGDEAYFSTFSADYRLGKPHLDVHPPLGKLLFSLPLFFMPKEKIQNLLVIDEVKKNEDKMEIKIKNLNYDSSPYFLLRLLSAFFGVLLVFLVYLFIKILTQKESVALLSAFFVALDNALLVQTRLILLDGFYLVFGFLALILFFKKKPLPIIAGLFWGLALGVKLTAAVFLGPIILKVLLTKNEEKEEVRQKAATFFVIGIITILLIEIFGNNLFISPEKQISFYQSLKPYSFFSQIQSLANHLGSLKNIFLALFVSFYQILISFGGYTGTGDVHPQQSPWYGWPLMIKPMFYLLEKNEHLQIASVGNPVIWTLIFLSVVGGFFLIFKKNKWLENDWQMFWLLFGSYGFSFLIFTFISRTTFIYHYLPALIFGIGLASWFIVKFLQNETKKQKIIFITLIIALTILGFLTFAPFTFGFAFKI